MLAGILEVRSSLRLTGIFIAIVLGSVPACSPPAPATRADALVEQLRGLPPYIEGVFFVQPCARLPCPPPPEPPTEIMRHRIYRQLFGLGNASVTALARALKSSDLNMKLNAELALQQLGFGWWDRSRAKLDISAALPALMDTLSDPNPKVRSTAAFDIAAIGPGAEQAVPNLIALLNNSDEGRVEWPVSP